MQLQINSQTIPAIKAMVLHFRETHPELISIRHDPPRPWSDLPSRERKQVFSHSKGYVTGLILAKTGQFSPLDLVPPLTPVQARTNCVSLVQRGKLRRVRAGRNLGLGRFEEAVYEVAEAQRRA